MSATLIASLAAILFSAAARAQPVTVAAGSAGSVSAIQGIVTIVRAGHPINAVYGMPVRVGDRINTGPASQVTITLADGTQLELTESSGLVIVTNRQDAHGNRAATRIDLFSGLVHSLVRFAPGNAPNYEVHTPNAVAAARGTNYDTDYTKGVARKQSPGCLEFTDVRVFEGTVAVSNPSNPAARTVAVGRRHQSTVACLLAPTAAALIGTTVGMSTGSSTTTGTSGGTSAVTSAAIAGGATVAGAGGVVGGLAVSGAIGGGGPSPSPAPAVISPSM